MMNLFGVYTRTDELLTLVEGRLDRQRPRSRTYDSEHASSGDTSSQRFFGALRELELV